MMCVQFVFWCLVPFWNWLVFGIGIYIQVFIRNWMDVTMGLTCPTKKHRSFWNICLGIGKKNSFWQEKNCKQKSFRISGSAVLLSTLSITINQSLTCYKHLLHLDLYTRGMWLIKYQPHFSVTIPTGHRVARVRSLTGAAVCSSWCSRAPCKVFVSHVFIMWASKQN